MAAKTEPSISELVGKVISDAQRLAMAQLALAKDEIGKAVRASGPVQHLGSQH